MLRMLITAGPTREYIDSVRYLSNESSGKMGFALAAAAAAGGHAVTLVYGPVAMQAPIGVRAIPIVSAADMLRACRREWPRHDVLIMAAAVADYAPARRSASKLKKSAERLSLELKPTPDVLTTLAARAKPHQVVIGFALEDRAARRNAADKLQRKRLDAIILNGPAALSADASAIDILVRGEHWLRVERQSKRRLATMVIRLAERLAAEQSPKRKRGGRTRDQVRQTRV